MPRLIDEKMEIPYRLKYDRAAGNEVTFYLRPLTHRETLRLTQNFRIEARDAAKFGTGSIVMDMADVKERVFIKGVVRVEGLIWPGDTEPVIIEDEAAKKKLFSMLSEDDGREILEALEDMSTLKEGEVKN